MLRLLLLEDQVVVRNVMREVIQMMDCPCHVVCAGSLAEARTLLASGASWDCLIADLALSDGKSLDFIEELRERGRDVPVILVSGFLSPDRLERAGRLGITHVLHKPFHPHALLQMLNGLFGDVERQQDAGGTEKSRDNIAKGPLLEDVFEMDRNLSLLYRIVHDMPQRGNVDQICGSALRLGMDMVRAERGFMALFESSNRELVMVAHEGFSQAEGACPAVSRCGLDATPFAPLLEGGREYVRTDAADIECWPGLRGHGFVAIPVCLQGEAMGVLCLVGCGNDAPEERDERPEPMLGLLTAQLDTLLDNCAVHAALEKSMKETLIALVRSLEARDRYTKDHSARVSKLAVQFARALGLDEETVALVKTGGLLHDIGKGGVPDAVLLKPGRLTEREFAIIKAHPVMGDAILRHMDTLSRERLIVRHHHERIDGRGYPDKLSGDNIPLVARIVCVADSIDAMTTHRVYRMARPLSFCVEQLKMNSGTQFDAQVVEVAIAAIEEGRIHTQAAADDSSSGDVLPAFLPLAAKS